jgi:hypothetical protein
MWGKKSRENVITLVVFEYTEQTYSILVEKKPENIY